MKAVLVLLSIASLALGQPDVGFLRVYNLMGPNETFTPFLGSKRLTEEPMTSGDDISGIYFKVGKYSLKLFSDGLTISPIKLEIEKNKTTTAIALPVFNKSKDSFEPRLVVLNTEFQERLPKGVLPLKLLSFSKEDLYLQLNFDEVFISAMGATHYAKWKGTPFSLKIADQKLGCFEPEERVGHTLILLDRGGKHQQAAMIPHMQYSPPLNLRDDLTFGKKKEAFKTLKKLPSRQ